METICKYRAKDGKEFEDRGQCLFHEMGIEAREKLQVIFNQYRASDSALLSNAILFSVDEVYPILLQFIRNKRALVKKGIISNENETPSATPSENVETTKIPKRIAPLTAIAAIEGNKKAWAEAKILAGKTGISIVKARSQLAAQKRKLLEEVKESGILTPKN